MRTEFTVRTDQAKAFASWIEVNWETIRATPEFSDVLDKTKAAMTSLSVPSELRAELGIDDARDSRKFVETRLLPQAGSGAIELIVSMIPVAVLTFSAAAGTKFGEEMATRLAPVLEEAARGFFQVLKDLYKRLEGRAVE